MAIAKDPGSAGEINVTSIVSNTTGEPKVNITWGDMAGQLTVAEARAHAAIIYECAEAAEGDAFVFNFLMEYAPGKNKADKMDFVLRRFMDFRNARGEARAKGLLP